MNLALTLLLFSVISLSSDGGKTKVGSVEFDQKIITTGEELLLNGAGVRTKWFIDLYATGLYVPKKTSAEEEIINCDCVQAFRIVIISSLITTENFNEAIDEVFIKSAGGNTKAIDERIARFKKALGTGLKTGTEFYLVYEPNKGLKVFRDGKYKDTIPGLDFKQATMKLWIGENCVSDDLKSKLLKAN